MTDSIDTTIAPTVDPVAHNARIDYLADALMPMLPHEGAHALEVLAALRKRVDGGQREAGQEAVVDPVAEIGREIMSVLERFEELDQADFKARRDGEPASAGTYREGEKSDAWDRLQCLQAYASTIRAESLEGALVQISLAVNLVYELMNDKLDDRDQKRIEDRFKRLIFSAVRALADDPKLDLVELSVWYHLGEHLDPWVPYESRVAVLQAKHG